MTKQLYVVDDTGEIVKIIDENTRILSKKQIEYLQDTVEVEYSFVKVNAKAYSNVATKYPIVNKLIQYIGYMDGILQFTNGRFIRPKHINSICDVSVSTAKRQMQGLIKEDVLHKIKDGKTCKYVFNPWICCKGKKIYISLYDEFKLSEHRFNVEEARK